MVGFCLNSDRMRLFNSVLLSVVQSISIDQKGTKRASIPQKILLCATVVKLSEQNGCIEFGCVLIKHILSVTII